MLLVAVAIIMVNALLMIFGPDARNVQVDYQLESFEIGQILLDKARLYAAGAALVAARLLFAFFTLHAHRQGDPRLRRQLPRRQGGRPQREAPLRAHLRPGLGVRRGRRLRDGAAGRRDAGARARTTRCSPSSSSSSAAWARWAARSLGGVLIGVSEALAGLFIAPSAKSMFSFGLLILVLLLRPQGLLGRRLEPRPRSCLRDPRGAARRPARRSPARTRCRSPR